MTMPPLPSDPLESVHFRLLLCAQSDLDPTWARQSIPDSFNRIYLLTKGECWVETGGNKIRLRPGDLALLPARLPLAYGCLAPFQVRWLHFTAQNESGLDLFQWVSGARVVRDRLEAGSGFFHTLLDRAEPPAFSDGFRKRASLLGLLAMLTEGMPPPELPDTAFQRRLGPVFEYVEANLGGDVSVPRLAGLAGMSVAGFTRLFTKHMGESPARWVLGRKIERARNRLRQGAVSSSLLAEELGFVDAFHFAKTCKRLTGLTPKAWRRSLESPRP